MLARVSQSTVVTGSAAGRPSFVSRDSLLEAACVLFAEHGYQATSMRDIASALGVRAPSLYNHVAAKQDILHAIMDRAMDRAIVALAEALDGVTDVADRLRAATESLVLDFLRNPAEVTVCNTEVRSLEPGNRSAIVAKRDHYAAQVRQIIDEGCRTGRFHVRSPRLAAFAVLEMGNGAKSWFRPDGSYSDVEVAREYGEFALRIAGHGVAGQQPGAVGPGRTSAVS
jgi:AcrR family transcriptional regulator